MIKIKIEKTDKFQVSQIIVEGHADIKKNKQNPVCSAISSVVLGTVNTVNTIELNKWIEIVQKDGYIKFKLKKSNEKLNFLLLNLAIQLQTIALYYDKDVKLM